MRFTKVQASALVISLLLPLASIAQGAASGDGLHAAPNAGPLQSTLSAGTGSGTDAAAFDSVDMDQDGFITRDEAAGTDLGARFDELDTNHDGKLSPSELNAGSTSGASTSAGASSEVEGNVRSEAAEEVAIDQVPPAAQAAILQATSGGTVQEIDRVSRNGMTLYEAAFQTDGKQKVMLVSPDGTVVAQLAEDDDDDDSQISPGEDVLGL